MTVAFIPAFDGSTSLPSKSITPLMGKPMIYWTCLAACNCSSIDTVYVMTDSYEVQDVVASFGFTKVQIIKNSTLASIDTALLDFAKEHDFHDLIFLPGLCPLLSSKDLENGLAIYQSPDCDSVLSGVLSHKPCWSTNEQGHASCISGEENAIGSYIENDAFSITSRSDLLKSKNRCSGQVKIYPMSLDTLFEFGSPRDASILEALMEKHGINHAPIDLSSIKLFLTDCDGCLTDGGMYLTENGDEIKRFQAIDGKGLTMLKEAGIKIGIVTGETRELLKVRAKKLGLDYLELGASDKLPLVEKICQQLDISLAQVAYVGDDLPDIPVIQAVGYGCSVPNGRPEVKQSADYITKAYGGSGAIREVTDQILKAKGLL